MTAQSSPMRSAAVAPSRRQPVTPGRLAGRIAIYLVLSVGAFLAAFPFIWMVLTSLKTQQEALRFTILPKVLQWHNYPDAWHAAPFGRYFLNTIIIAVLVVLGMLFTSTLAAYAFARLNFWGKNVIFALFLATMMIPFEATLIPNYIIINRLHWYNTFLALIVPWTASVFSIFLLRQFFVAVPQDLYDAAALDGCGHFRTLWSVVLPLARAPLAATIIFSFLGSWNSLLWPLMVTSKESIRPLQLGLAVFVNADNNDPQYLMAASVFTILPIIIFYFVAQRQFIEGIASSGLKG